MRGVFLRAFLVKGSTEGGVEGGVHSHSQSRLCLACHEKVRTITLPTSHLIPTIPPTPCLCNTSSCLVASSLLFDRAPRCFLPGVAQNASEPFGHYRHIFSFQWCKSSERTHRHTHTRLAFVLLYLAHARLSQHTSSLQATPYITALLAYIGQSTIAGDRGVSVCVFLEHI